MKVIRAFLLGLALSVLASAQSSGPSTTLRFGTVDPASCSPNGANVFLNTTSGLLKICTATNTWTTAGPGAGGGSVTNTGTLTAGKAILGNGGVDVIASKVTITDPATTATLTILNNKVFTVNHTLTLAGTDSTVMTFPTTSATIARTDAANTFTGTQVFSTGITVAGAAVTNNIVQNSQSAAYTTVLTDAGKHILHPTADNNARTFTIDSNANVAYPIGTTITFVNQINTVTIAITSDTMVLAGAGTTGSRTLAANGIATAIKIAATVWLINGTGLT